MSNAITHAERMMPGPRRCLVLTEPGATISPELLAGLGRRGMTVATLHDAPAVMVQLARERTAAVVLAQENAQDKTSSRSAELIEAIRRYYPHVSCWAFRSHAPDAPARLSRTHGDGGALESTHLDQEPGAAASPGPSRLSQTDRDAVSEPGKSADVHEQKPLVSKEELAMLLSDPLDRTSASRNH